MLSIVALIHFGNTRPPPRREKVTENRRPKTQEPKVTCPYCMLLATRFHFASEGDLYVGKFVVAERGTEKNGRMDVQGSAKKAVPRFGEFCYCFCLALPAAFMQPGDHLLAKPSRALYFFLLPRSWVTV